jgi:Ca2+-binding EF-hand superfamily protein
VFSYVDRDRSGFISISEFLRFFKVRSFGIGSKDKKFLILLKGSLSEFRLALIKRAFEKVDVNKQGLVTLEDLGNAFKATKHPAVKY